MAYKVFSNGNTLPASDLNTYLMNQSVIAFASTTARDAAITSPNEGMLVWLEDSNKYVQYNGTAWVDLIDQATIAGYAPRGNAVINGAFDIWQRGTSFTSTNGSGLFAADRWQIYSANTGRTYSQQASGLTGFRYAARIQRDSGNTATNNLVIGQNFETSTTIPLAGQTITLSFYARAGANYSAASNALYCKTVTGTGTDQNGIYSGYTGEVSGTNQANTLTTTWQRFTYTATIPTNATEMCVVFTSTPVGTAGAADYFEITGVQLEAGSVATPFKRNAPSIQAELAACQRYYYRITPGTLGGLLGFGTNQSTTAFRGGINFPVEMRTAPTALEQSGTANQYQVGQAGGGGGTLTVVPTFSIASTRMGIISATVASGLTQFQAAFLQTDSVNGINAYLGWSAEL